MRKSQIPVVKSSTADISPREIAMDLPPDLLKFSEPKPSDKREKISKDPGLAREALKIINDLAGSMLQDGPVDGSKEEKLTDIPQVIQPPPIVDDSKPKKGHWVVVKRFTSFESGGVRMEFSPGVRYDVTTDIMRILREEKVLA